MATIAQSAARRIVLSSGPWSTDFQRLVDDLSATDLPEVSPALVRALVVAEDHRFWSHCGIDLRSVLRAVVRRLSSSRCEGASTIQQQLVRVVTGRYEISLVRKVREMAFAVALGSFFTRQQLVGLYLARGYYGHGMSGVRAACAHLGVDPCVADLTEAAEVVARLRCPQPSRASPEYQARVARRVRHIVSRFGVLDSGTKPNQRLQPTAAGAMLSRRG